MTPSEFEKAGKRLFGQKWKVRMALELDIDPSTIWRYSTGDRPIPKTTSRLLEFLLKEKRCGK